MLLCVLELVHGLLTLLQKPRKSNGQPENLRPIILLSALRKLLTICIETTWNRPKSYSPLSQVAYQFCRGTTEQVITIELLVEKFITCSDYIVYLLLLDISKTFGTDNREPLFQILDDILEDNELRIFIILANQTEIKAKIGGIIGESFKRHI